MSAAASPASQESGSGLKQAAKQAGKAAKGGDDDMDQQAVAQQRQMTPKEGTGGNSKAVAQGTEVATRALGVLGAISVPGMESSHGLSLGGTGSPLQSPAVTVQRLMTELSRLHKRNPTLFVRHRTPLAPETWARSMCPAWLLVLTLNRRRNHDERYIIWPDDARRLFVLGIGMWALGQWLRRKGFGPQLDALDKQYTALQQRVNRLALPAAAHFTAAWVCLIACHCSAARIR